MIVMNKLNHILSFLQQLTPHFLSKQPIYNDQTDLIYTERIIGHPGLSRILTILTPCKRNI